MEGINMSFLVLAFVSLLIYLLYQAALPKPIRGIPYNREAAKSILGDMPALMKWRQERPELFSWIISQNHKHNSPIIQLFLRPFGKPWVILTDFRESQDIMVRRTKEFDRSDFAADLFGALLPDFQVNFPTDQKWKEHRRLTADLMTPSFLRSVVGPQLYVMASELMVLWKEKERLAVGRPFSAAEDVDRGTLDGIWAAAFGSEIGTTKTQIAKLSQLDKIPLSPSADSPVEFPTAPTPSAFNAIITLTDSIEIPMNSPIPRLHHAFALRFYPRLRAAMKLKDGLIKEKLDEAWVRFSKEGRSSEHVKCAMDYLVQREVSAAKKENRPAKYDTKAIRSELFGFLVGGFHTTATTICWGLKHLTANQDIQSKLRAELRAKHQVAFDSKRDPTFEEITSTSIPYLDGTLEEIQRLGTTSPSIIRKALCDAPVLNHIVPKGTDVFMMSCGPDYVAPPFEIDEGSRSTTSLESKDKYGVWEASSIREFLPERWLTRDKAGEVEFNPRAGPTHQFGAGPRACFGRRLALLELKIVFTLIVWNFQLQPIPSTLTSFEGRDVTVHVPQQCFVRLAEA